MSFFPISYFNLKFNFLPSLTLPISKPSCRQEQKRRREALFLNNNYRAEVSIVMNEENLENAEKNAEADQKESTVEETQEAAQNETETNEPQSEATEEVTEEESFKDKFYYLAAEMENMKRRFDREKESIVKYGTEKILNGLLPVLDNLDRTLQALDGEQDDKVKNIITGVEMVRNQFVEALKQSGLEPIESIGEIFDPNFHEAMSQQAAEGKEDMEIIAEFEKGYILNGRLIRAAKVVVVKN